MRVWAFIFCFFLLGVRTFSRLLHPEVWAEDGINFIADAILYGWRSLLIPLDGYYDFLQRTVVILLLKTVPVLWLPTFYGLIYLLIFAWVFSLWVGEGYVWLLPSQWGRFAVSLLCTLAPGLTEMSGNLCNLNWILFFWLALLGLRDPELRPRIWEYPLAALLLASIGTSLLLLPLFCFRVLLSKRNRWHNIGFVLLFLLAIGVLFQSRDLSVVQIPSRSQSELFSLWVKTTFDHFVFRPWLGDSFAISLLSGENLGWVRVCGLLFLGATLTALFRRRHETGLQSVVIFSLGVLLWPVLAWMARPFNLPEFEKPLSAWLLNHRYSFAVAIAANFFWIVLLKPNFEWKRTPLRNYLMVGLVVANLVAAIPRFWIYAYGKERRWPKLAPQVVSFLRSSQPQGVVGPIYPEGWILKLVSK